MVPYLRDDILCQAELSGGKAKRYELPEAGITDGMAQLVQYSSDGRWIAYPGRTDPVGSFPLFLQKSRSKTAACVAETAVEYFLLDRGQVLYLNTDRALYLADGKNEAVLLEEDILRFWPDEAQKHVFWLREDSTGNQQMYAQDLALKQGAVLLMDGFDDYIASPSGENYAFLADGALWRSMGFSEAELLERDVADLGFLFDSGAIYFASELKSSESCYDLVDDNLSLGDSSRLLSPDRTSEAYRAAKARELLREELKSTLLSDWFREIYLYDQRGNLKRIGIGRLPKVSGEQADALRFTLIGAGEKQISMRELDAFYTETGDLERSLFQKTLRDFSWSVWYAQALC